MINEFEYDLTGMERIESDGWSLRTVRLTQGERRTESDFVPGRYGCEVLADEE